MAFKDLTEKETILSKAKEALQWGNQMQEWFSKAAECSEQRARDAKAWATKARSNAEY